MLITTRARENALSTSRRPNTQQMQKLQTDTPFSCARQSPHSSGITFHYAYQIETQTNMIDARDAFVPSNKHTHRNHVC